MNPFVIFLWWKFSLSFLPPCSPHRPTHALPIPGGEALHADRVQMSRTVGVVHLENMLEENASFPGGGGPAVGALQRRLQGDGWQRRQDPDSCWAEHKTTGQAGPDLLRRLARFLPGESKNWLAGDAGTHVQQHSHGHQRLRPAVLRARLPGGNVGVWGELLVSFPLVLCSSVQEMLCSERAQSLSLTISAGTFSLFLL